MVTVDVADVYEEMLNEIREYAEGDPDADLSQLCENAIHESYQQLQNDK